MIASSRTSEAMTSLIEKHWIYNHGAPQVISADPEFCTQQMQNFLVPYAISLNARPARSSNKNGIVERKKGVFKTILKRLDKEQTTASAATIVASASFLTNMFHGSKILSAFQLARGFAPSILVIPNSMVTKEILDAHVESKSTRAIQKLMDSRTPHTIPRHLLKPGTPVFIFHRSSKHTEPKEWVPATVIDAQEYLVQCRRSDKEPPMAIAYEHIRIAHTGALTSELMEKSLEEEVLNGPTIGHKNDDLNSDDDDLNSEVKQLEISQTKRNFNRLNDMTDTEHHPCD